MRRLKFLCLCLIGSVAWVGPSYAHDSNMAVIDFKEVSADKYTLHVRTPLYYLDEAMRAETKAGETLVVGSNEYKKALSNYVKRNLSLMPILTEVAGQNLDKSISFGSTAIKVGGHETSIILELKGMKSNVHAIRVSAHLMTQNPSQINMFRFAQNGKTHKVFLDKKNNFSMIIRTVD